MFKRQGWKHVQYFLIFLYQAVWSVIENTLCQLIMKLIQLELKYNVRNHPIQIAQGIHLSILLIITVFIHITSMTNIFPSVICFTLFSHFRRSCYILTLCFRLLVRRSPLLPLPTLRPVRVWSRSMVPQSPWFNLKSWDLKCTSHWSWLV